jgi:hypothetical protein
MPQAGSKKKAGSTKADTLAALKQIAKTSDHYAKSMQRLNVAYGQQQDALHKAQQQKLWEQERQKVGAGHGDMLRCCALGGSHLQDVLQGPALSVFVAPLPGCSCTNSTQQQP